MTALREFKLTYGTFVAGGATDDGQLTGKVRLVRAFERSSVDYSFVIRETGLTDWATKIATTEAAFTNRWENFTFSQVAATLLGLSHTANTGYKARPTIQKRDDIHNTGRSRLYSVSIEFEQPAVDFLGRMEATFDVNTPPNCRRSLVISGTWTALPAPTLKTALEAFEASGGGEGILAYATSVITLLGGTLGTDWEEVQRPSVAVDHSEKTLRFSVEYQELIFPQAGGSLAAPNVVKFRKQQLRITRKRLEPGQTFRLSKRGAASGIGSTGNAGTNAPANTFNVGIPGGPAGFGLPGAAGMVGNTFIVGLGPTGFGLGGGGSSSASGKAGGARRLVELTARYDVWVCKEESIDLEGAFDTDILPFMLQQIRLKVSAAALAVTSIAPDFDLDDNRVGATIECRAATGTKMIEYRRSVKFTNKKPSILVPAWTGNPLSRHRYEAIEYLKLVVSEKILWFGDPPGGRLEPHPVIDPGVAGLSFILDVIDDDDTQLTMGLPDGQFDVTENTKVTAYEFYAPILGGNAPAGGGVELSGGGSGNSPEPKTPSVIS